jgi:hypothetical protein
MEELILNVKLVQRNDTVENWNEVNPILDSGEIGYDSSNNQIRIGNGEDKWRDLTPLGSLSNVAMGSIDGAFCSIANNTAIIPTATSESLGVVKGGKEISILEDGSLEVNMMS